MSLLGRSAIVTGGTGGLGSAVVKTLLEAGARVAVPFRRAGELRAHGEPGVRRFRKSRSYRPTGRVRTGRNRSLSGPKFLTR